MFKFATWSSSQWLRFQSWSKGRNGTWRRHWWVSSSPNFGGCPWGSRLRCHLPSATPHPSAAAGFQGYKGLHSDKALIQESFLTRSFEKCRNFDDFKFQPHSSSHPLQHSAPVGFAVESPDVAGLLPSSQWDQHFRHNLMVIETQILRAKHLPSWKSRGIIRYL